MIIMKKISKLMFAIAPLIMVLATNAQNNFPNGIVASKGASDGGSAIFIGTQYASHFHYSTTEDTYIRGGKSTSNVLVGDVGSAVVLGNSAANIYSAGAFHAQNGANATNGIYTTKGTNFSGSAVFVGSVYASHFQYSTTEDTYIRGGKSTSNIYIGDVNNNVLMGAIPSQPAGYRLYVDKGILTEKVKVAVKTSADWADHVFNKNYPLMPLQQVDAFIQANGHLPGIPSAEEMVKKGNDLGQTDAKLLAKIEELTLYMIEIKKENDQLKQMIHIQNRKIESIGTGIKK
jgi:hypothetical protein